MKKKLNYKKVNYDKIILRLNNFLIRPTKQRRLIAETLFEKGDRHVTAEQIFNEITNKDQKVSLATVYNTLNEFVEKKIIREISINSNVSYFDTNPNIHHHFYNPHTNDIIDIPKEEIHISKIPKPLKGQKIKSIDVVIEIDNDYE
tara:strand:- start:203 stop:640 length:438 start_codon:yes stop_codon:yes gene_type:complete